MPRSSIAQPGRSAGPEEQAGLGDEPPTPSGRSAPHQGLGSRLNERLMRLPQSRLRGLAEKLAAEAVTRGILRESGGARRPVPLTLRPRSTDLATRGYLHHAAWQLRLALRRLGRVRLEDPKAAAALPLEDGEREWMAELTRHGSRAPERIFCRVDALGGFDAPGGARSLRFLEANVVGVGGLRYVSAAENLHLDVVAPVLAEGDPELTFERNGDPRWLLLDELLDHARALGAAGSPTIAFVDDRSLYAYGGDFATLVPLYRSAGIDALYVDPRELTLAADGRVIAEGRPVDVIYRFLEIRELCDMEAAGADLGALRAAFLQGRVVPTAGGDLEHKSAFEVLTDPAARGHFSTDQLEVIDRHVLWTRLLGARVTPGPDGTPVDLPEWAYRHRTRLVIKPNRSYGGEGVVVGAAVDEGAWSTALERALRAPRSHVVQEVAWQEPELFPVLGPDGSVTLEQRHTAVGFYPGARGLGIFGRVGETEVVNLQTGGGISPFLVQVS